MTIWIASQFLVLALAAGCETKLAEIVDLYEQTLALKPEGAAGLFIRAHLPTLLDYAGRSRRIAELGVHHAWSSISFARAALGAAKLGENFRYRMYDIVQAPGVQKISPFLLNCSRVDFRFRAQDVLNQSFLEVVGDEDGAFPPVDLLFIDTTHTREQLTQELEAFAANTQSFIILHDTEGFGKQDEIVHNEGTQLSHRRKMELLRARSMLHVEEMMKEKAVSSAQELDLSELHEAVQRATDELEQGAGLQNALRFWLQAPKASSGEWEILEHSLADSGLTVLGRLHGGHNLKWKAPPRWDNATGFCRAQLQRIRQLSPQLLRLSPRYPRDVADSVSLDATKATDMEVLMKSARRLCAGNLEVKAAMRLLQWHMQAMGLPTGKVSSAQLGHEKWQSADWFLAASIEHRSLPQAQWTDILEEAIRRWPNRLELWFLLATAAPAPGRALHAWRRCLALCGLNRYVAAMALEALRKLGKEDEAQAWLSRLSAEGDLPEKLWEPQVSPSPVVMVNRKADASLDEKLQGVKQLVEKHFASIQPEILETNLTFPCAGCEQVLLEYTACHFTSHCQLVPLTCQLLEAVEDELPVLAASVVETASEFEPPVLVTGFPGRLRLWCPLGEVQVLQNGRVEGLSESCLWFDETLPTSLSFKSGHKMMFLVLDVLQPAFSSEESEFEISGEPVYSSKLYLQALLHRLGDGGVGGRMFPGSSITMLEVARPRRFQAPRSWVKKWINLATSVPNVHVNLCAADGWTVAMALQEDHVRARSLLGS